MISIIIAYAASKYQIEIPLMVEENCTIADAIALSNIRDHFPEIPLDAAVGVYGRMMTPEALLCADDRVEIYRPLKIDPKKARQIRVQNKSF